MPTTVIAHLSLHIRELVLLALSDEGKTTHSSRYNDAGEPIDFTSRVTHFHNTLYAELASEIIAVKQQIEISSLAGEDASKRAVTMKMKQWQSEIEMLNRWQEILQNSLNNPLLRPYHALPIARENIDTLQILIENLCVLFSNEEMFLKCMREKLSQWKNGMPPVEISNEKKLKLQEYHRSKTPGPKLKFEAPEADRNNNGKNKKFISESEFLYFMHGLWKQGCFPNAGTLNEVYHEINEVFGISETTAASKISQHLNTKKVNRDNQ